jgi:hypothetical protein
MLCAHRCGLQTAAQPEGHHLKVAARVFDLCPAMSIMPPELEIQIFESMARDSPYNAALRLNLMLVARRVKIWYVSRSIHLFSFLDLIVSTGWSRSSITVCCSRRRTAGIG